VPSRLVDLIVKHSGELHAADFALIALFVLAVGFALWRVFAWIHAERAAAQSQAIDTYRGLITDLNDEIQNLRHRNQELATAKSTAEREAEEASHRVRAVVGRQAELAWKNFLSMAYIAGQMRVMMNLLEQLSLVRSLAFVYVIAVQQSHVEQSWDPAELHHKLDVIYGSIEERVDRVGEVMPRAADIDRYLSEPLFRGDPFPTDPKDSIEAELEATVTELMTALAPISQPERP
jgi:hypothetical protein